MARQMFVHTQRTAKYDNVAPAFCTVTYRKPGTYIAHVQCTQELAYGTKKYKI
jgi:hypothetical protein